MGFVQNFFISFIVFSVVISGFVLFQNEVFDTAANTGITVDFNKSSNLEGYSKLDELYGVANKTRKETFLNNESTSEDVSFADLGTIGAVRSIFDIVIEGPGTALLVIENIANDLNIPPVFIKGALAVIIFMFFFAIASILMRRSF